MNILGFYKNFKHGKDEIAINLRKSEDKRVELLVKIFFWRNDSIKNKWYSELFKVCNTIDKYDSINIYPKERFILQELWSYWEDCFYDRLRCFISDAERIENRKIPEFNRQTLYHFLEEYHTWLAKQLSIKGHITISEVEKQINISLNKFKTLKGE